MTARRRYSPNGKQGVPICRAEPTLAAMIADSGGRLRAGNFGKALRAKVSEILPSRVSTLRCLLLAEATREEVSGILRRRPDAFEFDADSKTIRLYEAEDTSLLTEEKLLDYANLSRIAFDGFGWRVELFIIDRYGEVRVCDPEDLWEETVIVPEILEAAEYGDMDDEEWEAA